MFARPEFEIDVAATLWRENSLMLGHSVGATDHLHCKDQRTHEKVFFKKMTTIYSYIEKNCGINLVDLCSSRENLLTELGPFHPHNRALY